MQESSLFWTGNNTEAATRSSVRDTPAFDWLFIIAGGLPFILPIVMLMGETELGRRHPVDWYYWMNAIISAPHVNATYWRLTRTIKNGKVFWFHGLPAYLLFFGGLSVAHYYGYFLEAMTFVNVVQSYHYVRQAYGVYRYYTRQNWPGLLDKRLSFYAFHLAMPLFVLGRWNNLFIVWHGKPSDAIIPVLFPHLLISVCWVLAGVGLAFGLYLEQRRFRASMEPYNPVGLAILLVSFAVHSYGFLSVTHYQRGFMAVTIFHAIQYMALVWKMENRRDYSQFFFAAFWAFLLAATFALYYVLPFGSTHWMFFGTVVLAALSAHHYWADSVIWRAKVGR